jgi:hypothetical protein
MSGLTGRTLQLLRLLMRRRTRSSLKRFSALLASNHNLVSGLDPLLKVLETREGLESVMELAATAEEQDLPWGDIRDLVDIIGPARACRFLLDLAERFSAAGWLAKGEGRDRFLQHVKRLASLPPRGFNLFSALDTLAGHMVDESCAELVVSFADLIAKEKGSDGAEVSGAMGTILDVVRAKPNLAEPLGKIADLCALAEAKSHVPQLDNLGSNGPQKTAKSLLDVIVDDARLGVDRSYHIVPDVFGRNFHLLHDIREDTVFRESAEPVVESGKSLLYYDRLYHIYESILNVSRLFPADRLNVAEVGVYEGGTSYFLCDLLRRVHGGNARFYAVDTFEGHSSVDLPEGAEGLHKPGEFAGCSQEEVERLLSEFDFAVVLKGRIQDLAGKIEPRPFHFVHLDVDIYLPMQFSLKLFMPWMAVGGILCIDDYNKKSCPGVRQAVEEVLPESSSFVKLYTQTGQCLLLKTAT